MGRDYKKDTDSLDLFNTLLHRYLELRAASRNNETNSNNNQTQSNASRQHAVLHYGISVTLGLIRRFHNYRFYSKLFINYVNICVLKQGKRIDNFVLLQGLKTFYRSKNRLEKIDYASICETLFMWSYVAQLHQWFSTGLQMNALQFTWLGTREEPATEMLPQTRTQLPRQSTTAVAMNTTVFNIFCS